MTTLSWPVAQVKLLICWFKQRAIEHLGGLIGVQGRRMFVDQTRSA
ncbi:hypothetical protein ABTZ58_38455 [Streptomyces sp. NPDC094143]